jgi:hypothetical protein
MRFIEVKNCVLVVLIAIVLGFASCKKACYTCSQYCAYCLNSDSTFVLEACAPHQENGISDSMAVWQHQGYRCATLNNSTNLCDSRNGADAAVAYYEKENYFCYPQ